MVDRLEEPVEGAGLPNRSGSLEGRRLMVAQEEALEVDQRLVQLSYGAHGVLFRPQELGGDAVGASLPWADREWSRNGFWGALSKGEEILEGESRRPFFQECPKQLAAISWLVFLGD